jgi:hypothetical protein
MRQQLGIQRIRFRSAWQGSSKVMDVLGVDQGYSIARFVQEGRQHHPVGTRGFHDDQSRFGGTPGLLEEVEQLGKPLRVLRHRSGWGVGLPIFRPTHGDGLCRNINAYKALGTSHYRILSFILS